MQLRVVYISHFTSDSLPPCMQKSSCLPHPPMRARRFSPSQMHQIRRRCSLQDKMQTQTRVYSTAFPVFPTCLIFPSFSSAERYRVAVASETCKSFSTSSLVIFPFVFRNSRIFSSFLCLRDWIVARALTRRSCARAWVSSRLALEPGQERSAH